MLLWHHLFNAASVINPIYINGQDILQYTVSFARVSLYIFMILSAYGLYLIYDKIGELTIKKQFAFIADRYLALMIPFILCYLVTVIAQSINGFDFAAYYGADTKPAIANAIFEMLGVNYLLGGGFGMTINITWWYLSLMVAVIIAFPILHKIISTCGIGVLFIVPLIAITRIEREYTFIQYFYAIAAGMLLAKYDAISAYRNFQFVKNKIINVCIKIAGAVLSVIFLAYLLTYVLQHYELAIHTLIALILILTLDTLVFSQSFILRKIFAFFGSHSGNIYYLHFTVIFYILTDVIYKTTNPYVIFITAFILMIIISMILEVIKKIIFFAPMLKAVRRKTQTFILKEKI